MKLLKIVMLPLFDERVALTSAASGFNSLQLTYRLFQLLCGLTLSIAVKFSHVPNVPVKVIRSLCIRIHTCAESILYYPLLFQKSHRSYRNGMMCEGQDALKIYFIQ